MRRVSLIVLVLLFSSCFYRPVFVEGPPISNGIGTTRTRPAATTQRQRGQACREISRKRCDAERCKGATSDYVTLRCATGDIYRCEVNRNGCS